MSDNLCPSCGSHVHKILRADCRDFQCATPGNWSLVQCAGCSLVYTFPVLPPAELGRYYPQDYAPYNPSAQGLRNHRWGSRFRRLLMWPYRLRFGDPDWSEAPFGQGRLLDVGCGGGVFLREACKLGWVGQGIDLSENAVSVARSTAPTCRIRVATLEDLRDDEVFEYINLSHVLEHLASPREALRCCFDHLVPGGRLRINVPRFGGWESRLFGGRWIALDIPRHVSHFEPSVLCRLLEDVGFAAITFRPAMIPSTVSESFLMLLPDSGRGKILHSRLARCVYLASVFPVSVSYLAGNVGAIDVLAKKPNA